MLVAQRAAADLQRLAQEWLGFVILALVPEQVPQVIDRDQGARVLVTQLTPADLKSLFLGFQCLLQESQLFQRLSHHLQELRLHQGLLLEVLQRLERPLEDLFVQDG